MKFFENFLAALLAFIVGGIVMFVMGIMFLAGMASAFGEADKTLVKPGSILTLDLREVVTDSPPLSPFEGLDIYTMKKTASYTILQAVRAIEYAAGDPNISGVYITECSYPRMSAQHTEELRLALQQFKQESGKFVISYSDVYPQLGYYLASASDMVCLNPMGIIEWQGLSASVPFYRGLLDKLGVEAQVVRHGSFKAAVEPFIQDRMSPENRKQTDALVEGIWNVLVNDISASRGIDAPVLKAYAADLAVKTAGDAVTAGLADTLTYKDQVRGMLSSLSPAAFTDPENPRLVSMSRYAASVSGNDRSLSKNKVAVIYADGTIVDGTSSQGNIGGSSLAYQMAKARRDKGVKSVVLRVNSPGGSALASEVVWREMELLKAEKPVIVSMGATAASGGYYISCPADIIVSGRMTVTGSIGVFGILFNAQKGMKDKLGITFDVARTGQGADMGAIYKPMNKAERDYLTSQIEDIYTTFVGHVAAGRNLTEKRVDEIGGGRVWTGVDALEIGLTDGFGGIREAILLAAERAGVDHDFRIWEIGDEDRGLAAIFRSFSAALAARSGNDPFDGIYREYEEVMDILTTQGVQARMPYDIDVR